MTRITLKGAVWHKISRADWEFEGGESNHELLKLRNRGGRGSRYFRFHAKSAA